MAKDAATNRDLQLKEDREWSEQLSNGHVAGARQLLNQRIGTSAKDAGAFLKRVRTMVISTTRIHDEQAGWAKGAVARILPTGRSEELPLSLAQYGAWLLHRQSPSAANNISVFVRFRGKLDRRILRAALDEVIARHEQLRAVFRDVNGEPVQVIEPKDRGFLLVEQWLGEEWDAEQLIQEESQTNFDLSTGPLIRGRLLEVTQEEHVLLITQHEIVSDRWSTGLLVRDLAELYSTFAVGQEASAPMPIKLRYADYASWERKKISAEMLRDQIELWKESLIQAPDVMLLPVDRVRSTARLYTCDRIPLKLSMELTGCLRKLAIHNETSLSIALLSAWAVLLGRWSGHEEVEIGTWRSNRWCPEIESIVGPFASIVAIRIPLQRDPTVSQLLMQVASATCEVQGSENSHTDRALAALSSVSNHGLVFQVLFGLTEAPGSSIESNLGLQISEDAIGNADTRSELSLLLREEQGRLVGKMEFARELFERQTAERIAASLITLLESMVACPHQVISRLPLLTATERSRVLYDSNHTITDSRQDLLIHELVEEQAKRTPNAVALLCEQRSMTYSELNGRANQLARCLRQEGIGPDKLVALCVERGIEMVVGMLGILKAGGAYVPLDPGYPTDRLVYMLKDSMPEILLTQDNAWRDAAGAGLKVISFDRVNVDTYDHTNLPRALGHGGKDLAYVIYTSGSTGNPKAAMNEHRGMVNRILAQRSYEEFSDGDICCQRTSISFVDAVFEIFGALTHGRPLVIVPAATAGDPSKMASLIARERVTRLVTVPSLARSMLEDARIISNVSGLRSWTLSGEEVHADLLAKLQQQLPLCEFIIQYGASEVSSDASIYKCKKFGVGRVPIGSAVPNVHVYVLDQYCEPVPMGAVGEIYVGGIGVGRGYLNRPSLTAARFLPDKFGSHIGARLYKTGDIGRLRNEGTLEYLGRNDHQVKIRGFRIELTEIELQILRQGQVREAVVVLREDVRGDRRLVAYVVLHTLMGTNQPTTMSAADIAKVNVELIRERLKGVLPGYMLPAAIVVMDTFPVTPNGKLDRRALPAPGLAAYSTSPYEAPEGEIEQTLAAIWRELLQVERVGRRDRFFELGGDSLRIVQMMERLRRVGLTAEVRDVYSSPTLADLASKLVEAADSPLGVPRNMIPLGCKKITSSMLTLIDLTPEQIEFVVHAVSGGAENVQDIYPLAPLQEGILFHHLLDRDGGDTYVMATLLSVASRERLDDLISALQDVLNRHDILRSAVLWEQLPRPLQVVYREVRLPVQEITLEPASDPKSQAAWWMRSERQRLDLREAPLLRLKVAAAKDGGQWYALLQVHHIVSDDRSLRVLISEIVAHLEGRAGQLPEPMPYRTHVAQAVANNVAHDAEPFFRARLAEVDEPTAPFGVLNIDGDARRIDEAHQVIDITQVRRVRMQARRLSVTVATLMHAAWALVVAHTSARDDVVFGSVLLGRMQGSAGSKQAVGMFINTLPLRLKLRNVTARGLVDQAHQELMGLLNYEQASLAAAQRCSGLVGSVPLFTSILNYRHAEVDSEAGWSAASGLEVLATYERTNYPITLSVDDLGEGMAFTVQTDRRIDPGRVLAYQCTALLSLVDALERSLEAPVLTLPILSEGERRRVIHAFNATQAMYPQHKLVHELFEEQVERTPSSTAIIHEDQALTYAELNYKANQVAWYLTARGARPDEIVAICAARSVDMVVGLLGILKAGAAYMPLDPSYPMERLQYMLADTNPRIVLTQEKLKPTIPAVRAEVIALDAPDAFSDCCAQNLSAKHIRVRPENPVYVIYTSGSTGRPKGTGMPHRSMVNLIEWHRRTFPSTERKRVLQFAGLSFDVAFQEIFSTLCLGGSLVLLDEWIRRDARELAAFLGTQSINRLFLPPLMLQSLAESAKTGGASLANLEDVIAAGEQLRISPEVSALFKRMNGCRLHNHYGPTESHVVTSLTLTGDPAEWPALPTIGRPISNSKIYVLDRHCQPVAIGVIGEIYIGGASLATGYLGRPQLTAQRFAPNPFSADPQARLYRTGDLGRWQTDGNLEYLGRNDEQVKIRGYRIELGEIEAQLALQAKIKDVVVVAREDTLGEKRLVAYVTTDNADVLSVEELQAQLRTVVPEYMVPSSLVVLQELPITPNGKLNRSALPAPAGPCESDDYEAPQGEIEEAVAEIWRTLLHVSRVGRRDNFFRLGGHSLLATRVMSHIGHLLDVNVPLRSLFEKPTVEELSNYILQEIAAELSMEAQ